VIDRPSPVPSLGKRRNQVLDAGGMSQKSLAALHGDANSGICLELWSAACVGLPIRRIWPFARVNLIASLSKL
jgi:hypothetical protein